MLLFVSTNTLTVSHTIMNKFSIETGLQKITEILNDYGLYDTFKADSSIYIGGSLPSFCIKTATSTDSPNDIDVYTNNYSKTMNTLLSIDNWKFEYTTGIVLTFSRMSRENPYKMQFIPAKMNNMVTDVMDSYDCGLVRVAFHPATNTFIFHPSFEQELLTGTFKLTNYKSITKHNCDILAERILKLKKRAREWYDCDLEMTNLEVSFKHYHYQSRNESILLPITVFPPYIQTFHNKYNCVSCDAISNRLFCLTCFDEFNDKIRFTDEQSKSLKDKNILVFGGLNGFGKILADYFERQHEATVFRTGRDIRDADVKKDEAPHKAMPRKIAEIEDEDSDEEPPKKHTGKKLPANHLQKKPQRAHLVNGNNFEFNLNKPKFDHFTQQMATADIIVLNSYQTLEGNHKLWEHTIDNFDAKLLCERIQTNYGGYVQFIREIINCRKNMLRCGSKLSPLTLIFMDANESKYEGNMGDGKHLELNACKSACKNLFYSMNQQLSALNINVICYDVGWLSYHGTTASCCDEKSKNLISPITASRCLAHEIIEQRDATGYNDRKNIYDCSTYDVIEKVKKMNVVVPQYSLTQSIDGCELTRNTCKSLSSLFTNSPLIQSTICGEGQEDEDDDAIPVPFSLDELVQFDKTTPITDMANFMTYFRICDFFMIDCTLNMLQYVASLDYFAQEDVKRLINTKSMCATTDMINRFFALLDGTLDVKELNNTMFLEYLLSIGDVEVFNKIMCKYADIGLFLNDDNFKLVAHDENFVNMTGHWRYMDKPHIFDHSSGDKYNIPWTHVERFKQYVEKNGFSPQKIFRRSRESGTINYKICQLYPIILDNRDGRMPLIEFDKTATIADMEEICKHITDTRQYVHYFSGQTPYKHEVFAYIVGELRKQGLSYKEILCIAIVEKQGSKNINYLLSLVENEKPSVANIANNVDDVEDDE